MKSIKSVFFPSIEDSPGRVHHRSQDSAREMLTGRGKGGKWGERGRGRWGRQQASVNIHRANQGRVRSVLPCSRHLKKKVIYQCVYDEISDFCFVHSTLS